MAGSNEKWVQVDARRNIALAGLVKAALENEGIPAELRGQHLGSAAGELPLPEADVQVWVPASQADRAREIVARLAASDAASAGVKRCPSCGEENPANFEECWKCHAGLTEVPAHEVHPRHGEQDRSSRTVFLFALIIGALLGALLMHLFGQRAEGEIPASPLMISRWDETQSCVTDTWRDTHLPAVIYCDRDHDDVFESIRQFDRDGVLISEQFDEDDNGRFERQIWFDRHGNEKLVLLDEDQNGRQEQMREDRPGGVRIQSYDRDEDGVFELRHIYERGQRVRVEVDEGGRGFIAQPTTSPPP